MMQTEREYAEAMFALSEESGQREVYVDSLNSVRAIMRENPEYLEFLASPAIPLNDRLCAIDEAFSSCPEYVTSFLKILCENSRIRNVCECIDEFEKLTLDASGRESVTVYSVVELDGEQKRKLEKKLEKITGRGIDAVYKVDSSLIGGIRIELSDKIYDGTLKQRLGEVKEVISK